MGSMPTYHVSKGSEFGYLSKLFGPPATNFMPAYDAALARLTAPAANAATSMKSAANQRKNDPNAPALSTTDVSHFEKHWLGSPPDAWWPAQPVADVLRAGMREAIEHAKARRLPMEVLWVCALDQTFEVYFSESPNQVTVIIFTPRPREHVTQASTGFPAEVLDRPEDIWVVKQKEQSDGAAYQALGGATSVVSPAEVVDHVTGTVGAKSPIIKQRLFHT